MENSQRDMEKSRLKKEHGENLKTKWSVLFVNSTGKVFSISYIKPIIASIAVFLALAMIAVAVLASFSSVSINNNKALKEQVEKLNNENIRLKAENEKMLARLALLKPPEPEKEEEVTKTQPVKKTTIPKSAKATKPDPIISTPPVVKVEKTEQSEPEELDEKKSVEIKEWKILKEDNLVKVEFNILNILESDKTVSGYIFAILKNDDNSYKTWMISPYSEIVGGKPANPGKGQFFAISRFKPVTIKFPGDIDLGQYNRVSILVYSSKKEAVLEKGFMIDEK